MPADIQCVRCLREFPQSAYRPDPSSVTDFAAECGACEQRVLAIDRAVVALWHQRRKEKERITE